MILNKGDIVYIIAETGNGDKQSEWDNHTIKGNYEVVRSDKKRIYLKEDYIIFSVLKTNIKEINKINC